MTGAHPDELVLCFHRVGSMFCQYFTADPVRNWDDAAAIDGIVAASREALAETFGGRERRR